jgi:predicted transcriptional regulator
VSSLNFGVRLPQALLERLDERAEIEDRTRNAVIRRALEAEFGETSTSRTSGEPDEEVLTHSRPWVSP